MMMTLLTLLLFVAAKGYASEYYTAAVVEYATPVMSPNTSADEVILYNTDVYIQYMANASASQVDIIVFPEGGLHGHRNSKTFVELPSPEAHIAPCDFNNTFHTAVVLLSCAARKYRLYAVINLSEVYFNSSTNRTEYYNSNVAFDRTGVVVGRYRKYNPYGEAVTKPATPDHHSFDTDFGVRFGMFTCFDIEFPEPAIVLAQQYGIKHFAFPLCWISELPFLTALQAEWGWAYSLDVVLLAACCNDPLAGGTGSGIYHGKHGALQAFQTNTRTSRMLIARVPTSSNYGQELKEPAALSYHEPFNRKALSKHSELVEMRLLDAAPADPGQSNVTLVMLRDYLDVYQSKPLLDHSDCGSCSKAQQGDSTVAVTLMTQTTLCHNAFCCDFEVQLTSTFSPSPPQETVRGDDFSKSFYRLVVFDGVRWYGGGLATGGVQVCGIVSCANDSLTSCGLKADDPSRRPHSYRDATYGQLYTTGTVFQTISITPTFFYNNTFVYPDIFVTGSGDQFGSLLPSGQFTFHRLGTYNRSLVCSLRVNTPITNLITAAVYARQFDRDGQNRTEPPIVPSHGQLHPPSLLLIFGLFFFFLHCIFTKIF